MTTELANLSGGTHCDDGIVLPVLPDYQLLNRLTPVSGRSGAMIDVWNAEGPGRVPIRLWVIDPGRSPGLIPLDVEDVALHSRHPNLLTVVGVWRFSETFVIATERPDGTLWDAYQKSRSEGLPGLRHDELIEQLAQAARGLDFLNHRSRHPRAQTPVAGNPAVAASHVSGTDRVTPWAIFLVGGGVKLAPFDSGYWTSLGRDYPSERPGVSPPQVAVSTPPTADWFKAPEERSGQSSRHSGQVGLALTYCLLRGGSLPAWRRESDPDKDEARPTDLTMIPFTERLAVARALTQRPESRWPSNHAFVESLRLDALAGDVLSAALTRPDLSGASESASRRSKISRLRSVAASLVGAGKLTGLFGSGASLERSEEGSDDSTSSVVKSTSRGEGRVGSHRHSARTTDTLGR